MANNYIEELFIGIGFDTKRVKKEAKEVEKTLSDFEKKRYTKQKSYADKELALIRKIKNAKKGLGTGGNTPTRGGVGGITPEESRRNKMRKAETAAYIEDGKRTLRIEKAKQAALKKTREAAIAACARRGEFKNSNLYKQTKGQMSGGFSSSVDRATTAQDFARLNREMRDVARTSRKLKKDIKSLNVVQKGLNDSTRNMIRSYASLFAVFEGTVAIKRVGMQFDSLRASMLIVSDSEEDAVKKMSFVRDEAMRLGIDLTSASKAFLSLSASAGDALGEAGVKKLFTTVLGISTAFGMSVDDTKGTFRAFTQISRKGLVL